MILSEESADFSRNCFAFLLYFFDKFGTQLVIKLQAQTNSKYGRPETLRFFRAWRCLFSIEIARFVRPEHEENSLA